MKQSFWRFVLALVACSAVMTGLPLASNVRAVTRDVCKSGCTYSSIGDAITAATSGDVVEVKDSGTYDECIDMEDGVNVTRLAGQTPTISCSDGATVEFYPEDASMTCNLNGFIITHLTGVGAGIFLDGTLQSVTATISNCNIHDIFDSAGIGLDGTVNATIEDNTINDCAKAGIGVAGEPGASGAVWTGSSITIQGNTIGAASPNHNQEAGIFIMGSGSVSMTIGGTGPDANTIQSNAESGIRLDTIADLTIDNNTINNNTKAGILLIDVGSSGVGNEAIVENNTVTLNGKAGINIGGESYLIVGNNNTISNNSTNGIAFNMGDVEVGPGAPSSGPVTITGNSHINNNTHGGIGVIDAITNTVTVTENDIYSNSRGGIGIQNSCNLEITKNTIRENIRGGIHTGTEVANGGGFSGTMGSAVLTITKNKVYGNGASNYGGGIDVRHASGTITNNLVYENHRGGIRFGWENVVDDHITDINHNTVVSNGNASEDKGGGIIYDNLSGNVNDTPAGVPPGKLNIRNNISTHNEKAGIRACFAMTEGSEERNYNLVYANNGWDTNSDCGWSSDPVGVLNKMSCANQQYGGCGSAFSPGPWPYLIYPHDIMDDPLFTVGAYTLQSESPAEDGGELGVEMGAYGGSDYLDW